jgi:hypothetical protein
MAGAISLAAESSVPATPPIPPCPSFALPLTPGFCYEPRLPTYQVAVQFFFAHYTCEEPPLSKEYQEWLWKEYYHDPPHHALRAAIEATGMAGLSNKFYAPEIASESHKKYGKALQATKLALCNPIESVTDTSLVTVIALCLYEVGILVFPNS